MSQTTTPSGLHVMSVVERMQTQAAQYRCDSGFFTRDQCIAHTSEDREVRNAVAALIARNAELEAERDRYKTELRSVHVGIVGLFAERDALAADNLALREEAEMFRWMRDNCYQVESMAREVPHVVIRVQWHNEPDVCWMLPGHTEGVGVPSLDCAIKGVMRIAAHTPAKGNDDG